MGSVITAASMVALLSASQVRPEGKLALAADQGSFAGEFLAPGGIALEFDARAGADGSLDVLVTHDLDDVLAVIFDGRSRVTVIQGIRLEQAVEDAELGARVRALLDSPLWGACRALVRMLRDRMGRDQHAVILLDESVASLDRFGKTPVDRN